MIKPQMEEVIQSSESHDPSKIILFDKICWPILN